MALIVLDASILIALLDPADALHPASRQAFERSAADDLSIPASALAETLVGPSRFGRLAEAQSRIQSLDIAVTPIDEAVAVHAAELRGRHPKLRLPDTLVIAVGEAHSADAVLTGDRRWSAYSNRVVVIS